MARAIRDVDLIGLIKACGEAGVYKLKHGSLEIEFGNVWPQRRPESQAPVAFSENLSENSQEVSPEDELLVREMKEAELLIEDPMAYEQMQMGEGE